MIAWFDVSKIPFSRSTSSQKPEEMFAFLSTHVDRPGKVFLDQSTI